MQQYQIILLFKIKVLLQKQLSIDGDLSEINPYCVKLLKINGGNNFNSNENNNENIFLFVTDSKNHCIRKIDLVNIEVTTFSGECTEKGFKRDHWELIDLMSLVKQELTPMEIFMYMIREINI